MALGSYCYLLGHKLEPAEVLSFTFWVTSVFVLLQKARPEQVGHPFGFPGNVEPLSGRCP
jgi:hypothetical protein